MVVITLDKGVVMVLEWWGGGRLAGWGCGDGVMGFLDKEHHYKKNVGDITITINS